MEEEDEVEIVQGPPAAIPIPTPPSLPVPAPLTEDARVTAERRRKGKALAVSSAPEGNENEEEEEVVKVSYSVPRSSSAIRSKALAQEILRLIVLPQDRESQKSRSLKENVRSMYANLFKVSIRTEDPNRFIQLLEFLTC